MISLRRASKRFGCYTLPCEGTTVLTRIFDNLQIPTNKDPIGLSCGKPLDGEASYYVQLLCQCAKTNLARFRLPYE